MTATEAERRRAAGETPFCACSGCVLNAAGDLRDDRGSNYYSGSARRCAAALLRALVLQELVERIVVWCEEVAT